MERAQNPAAASQLRQLEEAKQNRIQVGRERVKEVGPDFGN